ERDRVSALLEWKDSDAIEEAEEVRSRLAGLHERRRDGAPLVPRDQESPLSLEACLRPELPHSPQIEVVFEQIERVRVGLRPASSYDSEELVDLVEARRPSLDARDPRRPRRARRLHELERQCEREAGREVLLGEINVSPLN